MPTTIISGLQGTDDPLANQLQVDMRDVIRYLDVDDTQFSTMLMHPQLSNEKATSFKVEWLNRRYMPRTAGLAASAASGATTFTFGTGEAAYVKVGDVFRIVSTGEGVRVTGTDAAAAVTGVRAWGGTAAASAASGADGSIVIVSNTNTQGSRRPTELVTQATTNHNYTGIIKNPFFFARTTDQTGYYGMQGGMLRMEERKVKAIEHKTDQENTLFFGARAYSAENPPRTSAGGLIEYITSNVTSVSGLSKVGIDNFLETGLQYGSADKVLFAAPRISKVLSQLLVDNWIQAPPDTKVWGARVDFLISGAFGTQIPVITKRQWGSYGVGTTGQYGSMAFLIDMQSVRRAPMQETILEREIQENDEDGVAEQYLAEVSLKVMQEQHHSILKNVTVAA